MKKATLIIILYLMNIMNLQAQHNKSDYSAMWKQADSYTAQSLPRSALDVINTIAAKAAKEGNTDQLIKALVCRSASKAKIDADSVMQIFPDIENLAKSTADPARRAILYSMLAELYDQYFAVNRYTVLQRTNLAAETPDDIKLWTETNFMRKIADCLQLSLQHQETLEYTPSANFETLLQFGASSRMLYPTLWDFLADRAIKISEIDREDFALALRKTDLTIKDFAKNTAEFCALDFTPFPDLVSFLYYSRWLQSLQKRDLKQSIVMLELRRNRYLAKLSQNYSASLQLPFLDSLLAEYAEYDFSVEIVYQTVQAYDNTSPEGRKKAFELATLYAEKYPKYSRTGLLKNQLETMQKPFAQLASPAVFHPALPKKIKIEYKNLKTADITIKNQKSKTVVKTIRVELDCPLSYESYTKEIELNIEQTGTYSLELKFDKKIESSTTPNKVFSVSRLASFTRLIDNNTYEFYVTDSKNGAPVADAQVTLYNLKSGNTQQIASAFTDRAGFTTIHFSSDKINSLCYTLSAKNEPISDYLYIDDYYYWNYDNIDRNVSTKGQNYISVFTDRSVYRPGQTLYFKSIINTYASKGLSRPVAKKKCTVLLFDANHQEIASKVLVSNEFGSIAGEFVLPADGLQGSFSLQVEGQNAFFRVEEYKRPTFQILFQSLKGSYRFGDSIEIKGSAENYSGIKLQDLPVEYVITRSQFFRWFAPTQPQQIETGTVRTDSNGEFTVKFRIPENDTPASPWRNPIFNFNIEASLTDLNGETQQGNYTFPVAHVPLIAKIDIPQKFDRDSLKTVSITGANLNGEAVGIKGSYELFSLDSKQNITARLQQGNFTNGDNPTIAKQLKQTASGAYRLKILANDEQGNQIADSTDFISYKLTDKRPPVDTENWTVPVRTEFDARNSAQILFGLSQSNITVLYEIVRQNQILQRQQTVINSENRTFNIPYKAAYKDMVYASFTYMVNGNAHTEKVQLKLKQETPKLQMKWTAFRNKLLPGQNEEWAITLTDQNGKPASAEILASMYDLSLDQIFPPHRWEMNKYLPQYPPLYAFRANKPYDITIYCHNFAARWTEIPPLTFDQLNWFQFDFNCFDTNPVPIPMMMKSIIKDQFTFDEAKHEEASPAEVLNSTVPGIQAFDHADVMEASPAPLQIRKNFAETAFFYPQLRTNEKGETVFAFTVPESNTAWQFRALAHDKQMTVEKLQAQVISQKELMITPGLPRFLRQGDRTTFSAKVSNLSPTSLAGTVKIEFFDPLSEKILPIPVERQQQPFDIAPQQSLSFDWQITVPDSIDMAGIRLVAQTASFSDGEQHALPVLPSTMPVTQTMTMNLLGAETEDFVFDQLLTSQSPTLHNYRLTLEYSANPAWYAIQAMPSLSEPQNDNAIDWFAAYFVNTAGSYMMKKYPNLSPMLNAWKQQSADKPDFASKLEQNPELKTALLSETPWVLDAKDETEQMNSIALLCDENRNRHLTANAIDKLLALQTNEGGWTWFKGMYPNRSLTQYILYGFAQLLQLGAVEYGFNLKQAQQKAIAYLDSRIVDDFNSLIKNNKDWQKLSAISTLQLEYLYVRSFYRDVPVSQQTRQAEHFYTSVAEKNWTSCSLYQQALLAVLAHANGNKTLCNAIMESLRERATVSKEMGMYWANSRSNVFSANSALAVHTFLIDAFKANGAPAEEMNRLKQWLLKQKQSRKWESTHATVNAIYAILSTGSNWLEASSDATITVGGKPVEHNAVQAGTGYVKQSWSGDQITPQLAKVTISKTGDQPAWGAMYWQYFEQSDKIAAAGKEIKINKSLYIETPGDKARQLEEITPQKPLRTGDKVTVRLTVTTDRDLEFVQLKDLRAACFEPVETISGVRFRGNVLYYQTTQDASTAFFFDFLPKGTYVFEYSLFATRPGEYASGVASLQSLYAPEFSAHSSAPNILITK